MRSRGSVWAAAALLVLLLAATARAAAPELLGLPLVALELRSDAPVDESGLRKLLPFRVGEVVTAEQVAEAERLLRLKRIFRDFDIDLVPAEGGVAAVVDLRRVWVISKVRVRGAEEMGQSEARRLLRLRAGVIYEPELLEAGADRLLAQYDKLGFSGTQVATELALHGDDGDVDVRVEITEGAAVVVAAVEVAGETGVPRQELQEIVQSLEGERRTAEAPRTAERTLLKRLRQKGYYEARVTPSWEPWTETAGILRFTVQAGPPFQIEIVGNRKMGRKKLLKLMDLEDRLIITDGTWRELARRMVEAYREARFYRAAVAVTVGDEVPKRVVFTVDEGRRYRLHAVHFEGNERLAAARLQAQMATQPRQWQPWGSSGVVVEERLEEDLRRIRALYRHEGFAKAKVKEVRREIDDAAGDIVLTLVIEEGPRTIVRSVSPLPAEVPAKDLVLKVRRERPLDPEEVDADRQAILAALGQAGYASATVEPEVTRGAEGENTDATVVWHVEPGLRQEIGAIVVQRNVDTRDKAILRELRFEEGAPLDTAALREGQADVYRLGLFRSVTVRAVSPKTEKVRDVAVTVVERAPGTFQWGAGYNTRDGIGHFLEIGYNNLGGMARRISLRGQFSLKPPDFVPDQYLLNLGYRSLHLGGSAWRYSSNLIGERATRSVDKFSIERVSFTNGIDRDFSARWKGGINLQVEEAKVFDVKPDTVLSDLDSGRLHSVALGPFLIYEGRDDALAPRRGMFDTLSLRYFLPEISTVQLAKIGAQHSQLVPIAGDVAVLYAARVGWARTIASDKEVPIRERLFLGGRTTVRGYAENSIGPRGAEGHETGGDLAINLNLELRVPLIYGFGAAVFTDGGGVYLQRCGTDCRQDLGLKRAAFSLYNFRRSAGLGLRYQTPVGPLSLDYGFKLDRRHGESIGALHFSIGNPF